jgi:hypothetical protein
MYPYLVGDLNPPPWGHFLGEHFKSERSGQVRRKTPSSKAFLSFFLGQALDETGSCYSPPFRPSHVHYLTFPLNRARQTNRTDLEGREEKKSDEEEDRKGNT